MLRDTENFENHIYENFENYIDGDKLYPYGYLMLKCSIFHDCVLEYVVNKNYFTKKFSYILHNHIKHFGCGYVLMNMIAKKLKDSKLICILRERPMLFHYIPQQYKNNESFLKFCLEIGIDYFEIINFFSYNIRNNISTLREEIKKHYREWPSRNYYFYGRSHHMNNPEIVLSLMEYNIFFIDDLFEHVPYWMKNDERFMTRALDINIRSSEHIGHKLKVNGAFIIKMLKKYKNSEYFEHCKMLMDPFVIKSVNFCLKCLDINTETYCNFPKNIKENEKVITKFIKLGGSPEDIDKYYVNTESLLFFIIKNTKNGYIHLHRKWKMRKDVIIESVKQNGLMLEHIPDKFREDHEIIKSALMSNSKSFEFLSDENKKDEDYIKLALKYSNVDTTPIICKYLIPEKDFLLDVVNYNHVLHYIPKEFKKDMEIIWMKKKYHRPISRIEKPKNMFFHFRNFK